MLLFQILQKMKVLNKTFKRLHINHKQYLRQLLYTYLLAMRAIESLLSPRQQLFNKTKPREIVAVKGDNKLVIDRIASE